MLVRARARRGVACRRGVSVAFPRLSLPRDDTSGGSDPSSTDQRMTVSSTSSRAATVSRSRLRTEGGPTTRAWPVVAPAGRQPAGGDLRPPGTLTQRAQLRRLGLAAHRRGRPRVALLEAFDLGPAHLVGNSCGASIAVSLATPTRSFVRAAGARRRSGASAVVPSGCPRSRSRSTSITPDCSTVKGQQDLRPRPQLNPDSSGVIRDRQASSDDGGAPSRVATGVPA